LNYYLVVYAVIAAFIAWIWIDYYRLIDIYGKQDLKYILLIFFLGASSVLLVLAADKLLFPKTHFDISGINIDNFLNCVFRIGLVEETAKAIPFFIILLIFKKQITEPIDYIAFICFSALGFSAAENVLYFYDSPSSISARAITSTVGHMFFSSVIGYGMVVMKFKNKKFQPFLFIGYLLLAALAHGFYDFGILSDTGFLGGIMTLAFFFYFISVFVTIIENALNHSSFFTYKKNVNSNKVSTRLQIYYVIVIVAKLLIVGYITTFEKAFKALPSEIYVTGTIIIIITTRLSRIKLIQGRWQPIRLELPFMGIPLFGPFIVKGETSSENYLGFYYEEYFTVCPISKNLHLGRERLGYIEKKLFLKDDDTFFLAKVFSDATKEKFEYMLMQGKTKGKTLVSDKYPMIGLFKVDDLTKIEDTTKSAGDFKFIEWGYVKPIQESTK
jgi:RsiW-degrading membrane proteinase PrsW (M82 family)